jgi:hypothetical protein
MGRHKKIKTENEKIEYKLRRREQNRISQKNFRLRRKILNKVMKVTPTEQNNIYKKSLTKFIKEQRYNYFITLTTKEERTPRLLKIKLDKFLKSIRNTINYETGFFVIEKKNRTHIHLLLKSKNSLKNISKTIYEFWKEGFAKTLNIKSKEEDYTLENYLIKEVYYNSTEVNWEVF